MPQVTCEVVARGGRTTPQPCPGSWCGIEDVNAWLQSSDAMLSYGSRVSEWAGKVETAKKEEKAKLIDLLVAWQELNEANAVLSDAKARWGLMIMAAADVDDLISRLVAGQVQVCRAIEIVLDAYSWVEVPAPAPPPDWKEIEKQAEDAWSWYSAAFGYLPAAGAATGVAVVVVGGLLVWALLGKKGRRR